MVKEHYPGEGLVESQPNPEDREQGRGQYVPPATDNSNYGSRREAGKRFGKLAAGTRQHSRHQ